MKMLGLVESEILPTNVEKHNNLADTWESFGGRACGMWSFHCLVYSPVGLEGGGDDEILLLS